jgi:hypothetical protein
VARLQAIQTAFQISIEPALNVASIDTEVFGDGLMRTAAMGHQDDLGAVPQAAVRRGPKGRL